MASEPTNERPTTSALDSLRDDPASRKRFLRMMGAGGASAFALLLASCGGDDKRTAAPTAQEQANLADVEIVNYALTLEYLEADFYKQVIDSGMIKDRKAADLIQSISENEDAHVKALIATTKKLGGGAATAQKTKFQDVIAAGPDMILKTAAIVENLGASAYLGQAAKIQSREVLAAALSIHSVEARHAAALNELVGNGFKGDKAFTGSLPDGPFAKPRNKAQVILRVEPFIV